MPSPLATTDEIRNTIHTFKVVAHWAVALSRATLRLSIKIRMFNNFYISEPVDLILETTKYNEFFILEIKIFWQQNEITEFFLSRVITLSIVIGTQTYWQNNLYTSQPFSSRKGKKKH